MQDPVVDGARQWERLGLLGSLAAGALDLAGGGQPDDGSAAEVRDQQVHLPRAGHLREPARDRGRLLVGVVDLRPHDLASVAEGSQP